MDRPQATIVAVVLGLSSIALVTILSHRSAGAGASGGESYEKKEVATARKILDPIGATIRQNLGFTVTAVRCNMNENLNKIPGVTVKKVHFIRHGEGEHNVAQREWRAQGKPGEPYVLETDPEMQYIDAWLTSYGKSQAKSLSESVQTLNPQLIVVSPMRRATQTGLIAFERQIKSGTRVLAHEMCHELAGKHTCDKRVSKTELAKEFPQVDYSMLTAEDDPFWADGHTREPHSKLAERCSNFIQWIQEQSEEEIVVAAHSQFLFTTFNAVLMTPLAEDASWFGTAEMRSMVLTFRNK